MSVVGVPGVPRCKTSRSYFQRRLTRLTAARSIRHEVPPKGDDTPHPRRGGEAVETKTGPSRGELVCHVSRCAAPPNPTRALHATPRHRHGRTRHANKPPWTNPTIARDGNSRARGFPCNTRSPRRARGEHGEGALEQRHQKWAFALEPRRGAGGRQAGGSSVPHTLPRRSRAASVSCRVAELGSPRDVGALALLLNARCRSRITYCAKLPRAWKEDLGEARTREPAPAV